MSTPKKESLFITFEGIDGCGKSTQIKLCAEALQAKDHEVITTLNPGGTEVGKEIRQLLLHHPGYVSPTSELLMYIADRAQHMEEVVFPALAIGKVVLCDRHLDSTIAYQGYGRGLNLAQIDTLNQIAIQGRKPDLTFLLDGPVETLAARVQNRGKADRMEQEKQAFHQRVRDGFLMIASQDPVRFRVMDAQESVEELHQQIMREIPH
ncbi:MAG: dTMP kinase [Vampirovibrio sp.]|nr:dTMP kinase [Vampirovibrio sp.]